MDKAGPPLPPSPLTRVVEVIPLSRVPLPWRALVFTLVAPVVCGLVVALSLSPVGADVLSALSVWTVLCVVLWLRYIPAVFVAALADRLAPSCPRWTRWGAAMGVIGLLPGIEYLLEPQGPLSLWLWGWKWWMLGATLRDACLGVALGWAVGRERWALLWAAGVGAGIWAAYLGLDLALGGIMLGFGGPTPRWMAAQVMLTFLVGAASIGVVLVRGVRAAWQRALDEGRTEGE